ncbi:MAG: hypothetical protein ABI772_14700 [Bacteroidota bacterium]
MANGGLAIFNSILYAGGYNSGVWRRSGNLYTTSGTVYYDENLNGQKDSTEQYINNSILSSTPANFVATTDLSGMYHFITDMQNEKLQPVFNLPYMTTVPSEYYTSTDTTGIDFAVHMLPNITDHAIDVTAVHPFRTHQHNSLVITVKNLGSTVLPALVALVPDSHLLILNSFPPTSYISNDTLYWNIDSLNVFGSEIITVETVPDPASLLGDSIHNYVSVTSTSADYDTTNNIYLQNTRIVGSYDPNDKTCLQGSYITSLEAATERLEYIVRFQNTGTAAAINITITDSLTNFLDAGSIHFIASSHPVKWSMNNHGMLEARFMNIQLPDSGTDEALSHGFI